MNFKFLLSIPIAGALAFSANAQGTAGKPAKNFNPDISVVVDGVYYQYSGDEPPAHVMEELRGFGHSHGGEEEHAHEHEHGFEPGFNLRHLELMFQADVDPYFKGWAIAAVDPDGAELEEAVILTTALPWDLQVKLGKFFSDYSRLNAQHAHSWNFTDAPMIQTLLLGDHGLNEKGIQLSWLAPTPFYLKLGAEALQGENEVAFVYHGDGALPEEDGPRVFVGWLKTAPNLQGNHAMEFGLFGARGIHQEEHLGETGFDDIGSHFLSGYQYLWGADMVYKYTPPSAYGQGAFTLEGGYMAREKDIDLVGHNNPAAAGLIGNSLVEEQDGLYLQGIYGFAPRWRLGLRGEILGLTNTSTKPDGGSETFDDSYRATAMVDWTLTEFSRLRLQASHGEYDLEDSKEDITEVFLQAVFSLGAHGAHSF